jgi:sRNA-binding protein
MKPWIQYAVLDLLLLAGAACGELVEEHKEADEKSVAGTSAAATAGAATSTAEATETAAAPPPAPATAARAAPSETPGPEATATVPPALPTITFSAGDRMTPEDRRLRAVRCVRAFAPALQPGGAMCNPT